MSDGIHTLAFGHREIVRRVLYIESTAKQIVLAFDDAVGLGFENIRISEFKIQAHPGCDPLEATNAIMALKNKVYASRRKRSVNDGLDDSTSVSICKRLRLEIDN